MNKDYIEKRGPRFCDSDFMKAQTLTKKSVSEVAKKAFVGMSEDDGKEIIDEVLKGLRSEKSWHPHKFRIGKNTIKSFREPSDKVILREDDIFYVDIGPVFNDHEGDFGKTFIIGENKEYQKIIEASETVFFETKEKFLKDHLTGIKLYSYAELITNKLGYVLNNKMNGHRVGDFPHALYYKGKLKDIDFIPQSNRWILEILICDKTLSFGAFYEDLI